MTIYKSTKYDVTKYDVERLTCGVVSRDECRYPKNFIASSCAGSNG